MKLADKLQALLEAGIKEGLILPAYQAMLKKIIASVRIQEVRKINQEAA